MTPDFIIGLWATSLVVLGSIILTPALCWILSLEARTPAMTDFS